MIITGIGINADAGNLDGDMAKLRRELEYCVELGVSHVEIAPHGVGAVLNGRLNQDRTAEVQALLAEYPLKCTVHGPNPMNLMNLNEIITERNLFQASISFASQVGSEVLVYHAGRYLPEEQFLLRKPSAFTTRDRKVMWNMERMLLRQMGDEAGQRGITVVVENARPYLDARDYCYGEQLEVLAVMVREVNHPQVGIALDIGHAHLSARFYDYDLLAGVGEISSMVRHIHLHDNFGKACASYEKRQHELTATGRGDLHLPVGWGSAPVKEILNRLPGYSGVITLEMRPRYRAYYREALDNLRALLDVEPGINCRSAEKCGAGKAVEGLS
ncbi:MAG: sugar phosphate isomerase/epimerase [Firmicutes bacterium]|nr:sugar phosphate isomerase/epimerase [Bacillota bacterium]